MHFTQEHLAGSLIEVMQEIREQHYVEACSIVDIECAAGIRVVSITHACFRGILFRNFEHGRPIDCGYFRLRIVLCESDSKHAMTCGDVEHAQLLILGWID